MIRKHRLRGLDQVQAHIVDRGGKAERLERAHQHVFGQVLSVGCVPDPAKHQLVDAHDVVLVDGLPVGVDGACRVIYRLGFRVVGASEVDHTHRTPRPSTDSNYMGALHRGHSPGWASSSSDLMNRALGRSLPAIAACTQVAASNAWNAAAVASNLGG